MVGKPPHPTFPPWNHIGVIGVQPPQRLEEWGRKRLIGIQLEDPIRRHIAQAEGSEQVDIPEWGSEDHALPGGTDLGNELSALGGVRAVDYHNFVDARAKRVDAPNDGLDIVPAESKEPQR